MRQEPMEQLLDWIRNRYFGKYRGKVTDNNDPTARGRLKVSVPSVLGELEVWAMPCVPYAGAGVGFYSLPEAGTGVWVEFEAGDPSYPIWTGCFWADGELPDDSNAAIKIWKTAAVSLRIDDEAGEAVLENDGGSTLTLGETVTSERDGASHTVGGDGVVSEMGATKTEVGSAAFIVNNGSLEVM